MKKPNWKSRAGLICGSIGLLAGASLLGKGARADRVARHPGGGHVQGGGGDGVPSPFADTNRFVDLADGESYTLIGRIVFRVNQAYFNVDLDEQPWLATSRTRQSPYFLLNGDMGRFYSFADSKVRMVVRARGQVVSHAPLPHPSAGGAPLASESPYRYEISLTPVPQSSIEVLR